MHGAAGRPGEEELQRHGSECHLGPRRLRQAPGQLRPPCQRRAQTWHVHPAGSGRAVPRPAGEVRGAAREVPASRGEPVPRRGADLAARLQGPLHEGVQHGLGGALDIGGRRHTSHAPSNSLHTGGPGGDQQAGGAGGQAAEPEHAGVQGPVQGDLLPPAEDQE